MVRNIDENIQPIFIRCALYSCNLVLSIFFFVVVAVVFIVVVFSVSYLSLLPPIVSLLQIELILQNKSTHYVLHIHVY